MPRFLPKVTARATTGMSRGMVTAKILSVVWRPSCSWAGALVRTSTQVIRLSVSCSHGVIALFGGFGKAIDAVNQKIRIAQVFAILCTCPASIAFLDQGSAEADENTA
ncbi:MAG: hypothetical protein LBV61_03835 [Burkholderiaceae bacterium]|jgi:hypothetical protein|nr:hypothetical protein [Burkholderiaceae bacterium]